MTSRQFSINNFDLIRLFAASQVAICHTAEILSPDLSETLFIKFLNLFPGVPIFFFVSGYLISRAYENSQSLSTFAFNRSVRIFPALHVCVFFNLALIAVTGYFAHAGAGFIDVALLYLAKTSILQFYNPDFMRAFGDGVLNGSLWTITVELQFYFLTPLIYTAFIRKEKPLYSDLILIFLIGTSLFINRSLYQNQDVYGETILWKLVRVSFAPWIYMFLAGVLCQRHYKHLLHWLSPTVSTGLFFIYAIYAWLLHSNGESLTNSVGPIIFFPLAVMVLGLAYSKPGLSRQLLGKNDISYGIYIYHMPVVNQLIHFGVAGILATVGALVASLLLALASWFMIERPFLSKKRSTINDTLPVTEMEGKNSLHPALASNKLGNSP